MARPLGRVRVEFHTVNEAFSGEDLAWEIGRILRAAADTVERHGTEVSFGLYDVNGNPVGELCFDHQCAKLVEFST